ncbi:hypothetical protein [Streptomyces sp. JJ36]|uniref:hypothetical protein n=1 Tax=Streptomyces sp. JJ36 TaxID=2736645 RepID=UPI001F337D4F|nr:hypothetical protein [Streptomyces sp. JJ36]MCF6525452.1 hypothetical protein [Streptomyces sp. JJ36]
MRKIRAAAAVAAMVAGLGTVGAGAAFAGGHPPVIDQTNTAACEQDVDQNSAALIGDVNLALGLGLLGQGEAEVETDRSINPTCEFDQENEVD